MEFPTANRYSQRKKADLGDSDEFRMYHCKILPCRKRYSHDWSECVFAHAGEKVQRRCPRKYKYIGFMCPDMRKDGVCPRGENCCFAHNSFEYWLHPSRYRTELCTFGLACKRPVCFFAHTPAELRTPNTARPAGSVVPAGYMSEAMMPDTMSLPGMYQSNTQAQFPNQGMLGHNMVEYPRDTTSPQFSSAMTVKPAPIMPYSGANRPCNTGMTMPYNDTQADVPYIPYTESPSSSSQDSTQFNVYEQHAMPRMSIAQHTPALSNPEMLLFSESQVGTMLPMEGPTLPDRYRMISPQQQQQQQQPAFMGEYSARNGGVQPGFANQQGGRQWPLMY